MRCWQSMSRCSSNRRPALLALLDHDACPAASTALGVSRQHTICLAECIRRSGGGSSLGGHRTVCCTSADRVILCQYTVCFRGLGSAAYTVFSLFQRCHSLTRMTSVAADRIGRRCDSTMVRRAHALVLAAVLLAAGSAHAQSLLHVRLLLTLLFITAV